jgi:hypothetical protein
MKDFLDLFPFMPIAVVAFTLGVTFAVRQYTLDRTTGNSPKWLILIPLGCGFVGGVLNYFVVTPPEALALLSIARRIVSAIYLGMGCAGASVLIWELKTRFLPNLFADKPPGPPTP